MQNKINIRAIVEQDDPVIAKIVRDVLTEFGANRPGFAWQDPELDYMTRAYTPDGRSYMVVEVNGQVVGGGGIGEFECDQAKVCELQKMYLLPNTRGLGLGKLLMDALLQEARMAGYQQCYLETLSSMDQARELYKKTGFKLLDEPLGDSGHNACDEWYLLNL